MKDQMKSVPPAQVTNFIKNIIDADQASGKHQGRVATRFPPEPNGYLHIGHAKSICLNFGLAREYKGTCNLRMDDTNPAKESDEYVQSIIQDVRWLGFDWQDRMFHASDYFEQLYQYAELLIQKSKAYVCSLSTDEIRAYRGTLTEPGKESPYRNRSVQENLDMFRRMRAGEFEDGEHLLRAKIDMTSGNINMRDPAIYRIRRLHHQRSKDEWCIYPMYDYAHCVSDAIEGITHSLCTLEFEDHRPLYDWFLEQIDIEHRPRQIEFARLNLNYIIMSKRKLKELVDLQLVDGWDDPRLPTISGLRRRGYTPKSIRDFCDRIGISKKDTIIDMSVLEECVRNDLNEHAPRAMAVLDPIKVVIETIPEGQEWTIASPIHAQRPEMGTRTLTMGRSLWIDRDDFMIDPPKDFFRLGPGREVRLRNSFIIKCERFDQDAAGRITTIYCSHDPDTLGKNPVGRKVKGIIHWLETSSAVPAEFRLYDRLFTCADPDRDPEGRDYKQLINPDSLSTRLGYVEASAAAAKPTQGYQFERLGYFCVDQQSAPEKLIFNRTVGLRDTWAKVKS